MSLRPSGPDKMQIYLDHNSTTPLDPRVVETMLPFLSSAYGNPSSSHTFGAVAARAVDVARQQVADMVGASPSDVIFCSSATESINTAVSSVTDGSVVTTVVEHAATRRATERLEQKGVRVVRVKVNQHGELDVAELTNALDDGRVSLVTILWANNETGVIFPIDVISELCAARSVLLHVDAVQAVGKIAVDIGLLPIDFLSLSAHKINGPKGIAALVARNRARLRPLLVGGQQENGFRAGTENVPGIVGFGTAAAIVKDERVVRHGTVRRLRDRLESELLHHVSDTWVNGAGAPRLVNTSNIGFTGIDGDDLCAALDARGIAVSTGSACHSNATEPSHVIRAMTGSYDAARSSVRFSLSHLTTDNDIQYVVDSVASAVADLR